MRSYFRFQLDAARKNLPVVGSCVTKSDWIFDVNDWGCYCGLVCWTGWLRFGGRCRMKWCRIALSGRRVFSASCIFLAFHLKTTHQGELISKDGFCTLRYCVLPTKLIKGGHVSICKNKNKNKSEFLKFPTPCSEKKYSLKMFISLRVQSLYFILWGIAWSRQERDF